MSEAEGMSLKELEMMEEYVAAGGTCCPWCGNEDGVGDGMQVDGPTAWQEVTCSVCGGAIKDVYVLKYAEIVERPMPDDEREQVEKDEEDEDGE